MIEFFATYFSTIVVGGLVGLLLFAVIIKMIKDKKKGKSSCGCHCADCPSSGMCHPK